MNKIRAFIDLGTNTFHLLIAEIKEENSAILYRTREIVGLGAGGINDGRITAEAFQRGLDCLDKFKAICAKYNVEQINAFGTSALRNAGNNTAFIDAVRTKTGINIEVIGGDREAELIQLGISASVNKIEEPYLIMDIGGGSTEFILVNEGQSTRKQSFEVGVQRLISTYFSKDPIPGTDFTNLSNYLNNFLKDLGVFKEDKPRALIGASGTFTTLFRMYAEQYNLPESSDLPVPRSFFNTTFDKLLTLPREKRLALPGMSAPRVDLIVVGSCLVNHVVNYFNFDGFYVSGNGLKEGAMLLASKGKL